MSVVDQWFKNKKKTYWKIWELKEGGHAYFMCFPDDIWEPAHYGSEMSEEKCIEEIKWVIASYLKRKDML